MLKVQLISKSSTNRFQTSFTKLILCNAKMNVKACSMTTVFILLIGAVTVLYCSFWALQEVFATDKLLRFLTNASRLFDTSWEDETYVPLMSRHRRRFLMWYFARPDIASLIGPDTGAEATQYVIYRCDTGRMSTCGGWADRIKGMMTAYIIANLTGRNFKVELLAKGCDITEYLIPNLVDWRLPVSFHKSLQKLPNDTGIINFMNQRFANFSELNLTSLTGAERFVYFKTNTFHVDLFKSAILFEHELSWMRSLTHDQVTATVYKRLFVLHPRLQVKLQSFLFRTVPTPQHKLVCVHVRMGQNPTIPRDSEIRNSPENLFRVWEFIEEQSKTDFHKVFIMADSMQTIDEAGNQSFKSRIVENPGPIIHVERYPHEATKSDICQAEDKIVFDQHVLMNCDILMISYSGLSQMAAFVRGSDHGLYCLLRNGTIVPCTTENILTVYNQG
ncbi:unnamed protein product [Candidula unifasciata]|uniref:Uncharacterized protein n=1 Tax=Candidula unifasciata TaxID=100452 RepID=A0A8S4A4F1_9EUPU|nr:unnamed protein product [Candidula unifasciata]